MHSCVILYRSPEVGVFAEPADPLGDNVFVIREFADLVEAIAYAENHFGPDVPYQIVELDEL